MRGPMEDKVIGNLPAAFRFLSSRNAAAAPLFRLEVEEESAGRGSLGSWKFEVRSDVVADDVAKNPNSRSGGAYSRRGIGNIRRLRRPRGARSGRAGGHLPGRQPD